MPVIGISVERLHKLVGADVDSEQIERLLDQIGCDVEGVVEVKRYQSLHSDYVIELVPGETLPLTDPHSGFTGKTAEEVWREHGAENVIRLDLLPVRPDIFDAGGLARGLRGYLGVETGLKDYHAKPSGWKVEVDPRITDPKFGRPLIQCAIIRNITLDDETLRAIMKLQENLHWALCRDRKFASIGAYDLAKLNSPIAYTLVDRNSYSFTPLFWGHRDPVSPKVMLEEHPKGMDYAHLVDGMNELPALVAANDALLSLPPIINSEDTKVTPETTDLFLDVTGHNLPVVTKALNILATSIAELDPSGKASIETVEIAFPDGAIHTPELAIETFTVDPKRASKIIGVELSRADCTELLQKMRHGVSDSGDDKPLTVSVAAYRNDIMHEVDLIEDVAIAYGYHNIKPELVPTFTAGKSLALNDRTRRAVDALVGLGFTETLSLVLTNENEHFEKMLREPTPRRAMLQNPISQDQTMLRENLFSSLLKLLMQNTGHPLPQKIFEAGDIVTYSGMDESEEEPREERWIAGAICGTGVGYAEGRSVLDALMHEMRIDDVTYSTADNPSALPGRAAVVSGVGDGSRTVPQSGGKDAAATSASTEARATENDGVAAASPPPDSIAEVFEVHPQVLENFRLGNPVVLFTLKLGNTEYVG